MSLEQTKGKFKLVGIVNGLMNDGAYREGVTGSGRDYRSIRFGVKTSPTNNIFVEMFGQVKDEVGYYDPIQKTSVRVPFSQRNNLPEGRRVNFGKIVGLQKDLSDKVIRETLVDYDAVKYINEHLQEGDSVYVEGEFGFSIYEGKNQTKYNINRIYLQKNPIDFEDEKFKETASFEQEIIINEVEVNKEEKKAYVNVFNVLYNGKFNPAQFVIDGTTEPDLANNAAKQFKFGDLITVQGECLNRVEVTESKTASANGWGSKQSGFDTIKTYTTELRITYADIDSWKKRKYKEDDFVVEESVSVETGNPFAVQDDGNPFEVNADDLPF